MNGNNHTFLKLVQLGLGHSVIRTTSYVDWPSIKKLAARQGLTAIILKELGKYPKEATTSLSAAMKLEWIGDVLLNYEQRYKQYENTIGLLAGFYNQHGFKMMVLKGYACALDWPEPEHRPCGDIDIWLFGDQKAADAALSSEKSIKIDGSHHHHTVFEWHGFTVENHYDFVNVHAHKSSKELEVIFKELGQDDSHFVEVNGEKIYLPSANLHALFLVKHMVSHFAAAEITLRQVLDWAFFVEKHRKEIDWDWLSKVVDEYHMKDFYNLINAICIEDLGFEVDIFPSVQFQYPLKDRVLNDILEPEYTSAEPIKFLPRVIYKYRRWQGNAWKQEMCYGESRWSAFWSGIWAKILKPASI